MTFSDLSNSRSATNATSSDSGTVRRDQECGATAAHEEVQYANREQQADTEIAANQGDRTADMHGRVETEVHLESGLGKRPGIQFGNREIDFVKNTDRVRVE
jgi:hypothetical protein